MIEDIQFNDLKCSVSKLHYIYLIIYPRAGIYLYLMTVICNDLLTNMLNWSINRRIDQSID